MDTEKTEKITIILARILSFVFHPLFCPLYGLAIIFTAPTFLGYLPATVKKMLLMIVLANNVMIPVVMLPCFGAGTLSALISLTTETKE